MKLSREEVIEKIADAFRDVTRDGGISWSEADAIDDYASKVQRAAARAKDKDKSWQEVADDPDWTIDRYDSNFSFLDAIGYRYYLAAAITRQLKRGTYFIDEWRLEPRRLDREIFSLDQRLAIAEFLRFQEQEDEDS